MTTYTTTTTRTPIPIRREIAQMKRWFKKNLQLFSPLDVQIIEMLLHDSRAQKGDELEATAWFLKTVLRDVAANPYDHAAERYPEKP